MYEPLIPPVKSLLLMLGKPFKPAVPLLESPNKAVLAGILLLGALIIAVRIAAVVS